MRCDPAIKRIIGQHYWAISKGEAVVVLACRKGYQVCGAWECGMSEDEVQLVDYIDTPRSLERTKLYYHSDVMD